MAPVASPAIAPLPTPSDPAFLSREALCPRLGQTELATMAAVEVARGLHHSLVEPTDVHGWFGECPRWLLGKIPHHYRRRGRRIVNFNS